VVCGIHSNVHEAMNAMGHGFDLHYAPEPPVVDHYQKRYLKFKEFGSAVEALVDRGKVERLEMHS